MTRATVRSARREVHPAEDLYQHPGHLIRRAQQALNSAWADKVSKTISSPQFAVMNALLAEPELDQRTVGERVDIDRSTMADIVARLRARGLLEWTRDSHDGRRKKLRLTSKGRSLMQDIIPRTWTMTRHLVRALSADEQAELLRLLGKVVLAHDVANGSTDKARRPK